MGNTKTRVKVREGWYNNGRVAVELQGEWASIQGNILASTKVVSSALAAYRNARKNPANNLADRLLAALEAGSAEGGPALR